MTRPNAAASLFRLAAMGCTQAANGDPTGMVKVLVGMGIEVINVEKVLVDGMLSSVESWEKFWCN